LDFSAPILKLIFDLGEKAEFAAGHGLVDFDAADDFLVMTKVFFSATSRIG
jgi:hypothetical protein